MTGAVGVRNKVGPIGVGTGPNLAYQILVKTDNTGTSASNQFTLPATGTYDVNWGDGSIQTAQTGAKTHTFASAGTYVIKVTGGLTAITFNNGGDRLKLLEIQNWGAIAWTTMGNAYFGCANMQGTFTDLPNLVGVTSMAGTFRECTLFNGDVSGWNTATVTDMNGIFSGAAAFNQNISSWNTTAVTNMAAMFRSATAFDQNIGGWNVAAVTDMNNMLAFKSFNQDISSWNVGAVTNMSLMFRSNPTFNQDISGWNVSAVTNMANMFDRANAFNQNIGGWNTAAVTNMSGMFTFMSFNQDISSWNVGAVTNMSSMFQFNAVFNQNIGSWNVSAVTNMSSMFQSATAFNQNIGSWNVAAVTNFTNFMAAKTAANYSAANLDAIYNGWSLLTLQTGLTITFNTIKYTAAGQAGRDILTGAPNNWSITDGGI